MRQSMQPESAASSKAMSRASPFYFSIFVLPLHVLVFLTHFFLLSSSHPTTFPDVNTQNPQIKLFLSQNVESFCERLCVSGTSRLNLKSYASTLFVTLKVSEDMELRLQENIEICLHRNTSLETCQCGNDDWRRLQKGEWKFAMSPYDTKFVDIKFKERISGFITVYVVEEFQQWRLFCLGIGFLMLLIAPIVSKWVPFYYSSSMALGVFLVILLILFQGMKLLPMGRKNFLYLTFYGSVLGIGSYIAHYFSTLVNSILVSFGMSDEMHNPVSIFLLVGIVLAGAALGYWIVRKFVLTEDGQIDAGIAQFVKWSMRFIAVVFLLQSSHDTLLALAALGTSWSFCSFTASSIKRPNSSASINKARNPGLWQQRAWLTSSLRSSRNAEFLNPSGNNKASRQPLWRACPPSYLHNLSNSPLKGTGDRRCIDEDFYSSFHKAPARKFSKTEWEDFTRESTRGALSDWASTPEVARWIADNACRMRLIRDGTSDDSVGSSSGSSEETAVDDGSCLSIFKWPFSS